MTSVDAVSAAIYGGVLLAHIPRAGGGESGWHTVLSVVLVLLLFVLDRVESLCFPRQTTPTSMAISLLTVRIALMAVVVQLDVSTLAWFLFLIPPVRASLYFGNRISYVVAAITWLGFFLKHWGTDPDAVQNALQHLLLFSTPPLLPSTLS